MATHPSARDQPLPGAPSFFEKLGANTESKLEDFFQWWGYTMASSPWVVLFLGQFCFKVIFNILLKFRNVTPP